HVISTRLKNIVTRKSFFNTYAALGVFNGNDFVVCVVFEEKEVIVVCGFGEKFRYFEQRQKRPGVVTHNVRKRQMPGGWKQICHEANGFVAEFDFWNHHFFGMAIGEENAKTEFGSFQGIAPGPIDEIELSALLHRQ